MIVGCLALFSYGRRVDALDTTLPHNSQKHDLADLLCHAESARKLSRTCEGSLQNAEQGKAVHCALLNHHSRCECGEA